MFNGNVLRELGEELITHAETRGDRANDDEATTTMQTSNQRWCEAETNRIAGEISLPSPKRDAAKAEAYFRGVCLALRPPVLLSLSLLMELIPSPLIRTSPGCLAFALVTLAYGSDLLARENGERFPVANQRVYLPVGLI